MVITWILIAWTEVLTPRARAQTADVLHSQPESAVLLRRIVLADAPKNAGADWAQSIYLDLANAADAAFGVKLNTGLLPLMAGDDVDPTLQSLSNLQYAADADAILRHRRSGWELLQAGKDGPMLTLGTAPPETSAGQATRQILGYDAVVLARRDRVVEALVPDLPANADLYAVAIGDSAATAIVKEVATLKRTALLHVLNSRRVKGYGTVARLSILSVEPGETLAFGTKLRLQR